MNLVRMLRREKIQLTEEQIEFLNKVCGETWTLNSNGEVDVDGSVFISGMNLLIGIPVRFGEVNGYFSCQYNQLTTLEFCPSKVGGGFGCYNNQLTNYFKNIKEEDFLHWENLIWVVVLEEYPFLINIIKKCVSKEGFKLYITQHPQIKLYLK